MYKYQRMKMDETSKKNQELHPIWRGVGFAMMIIIPVISYVGALVILDENDKRHWFPVPWDLAVPWQDPLILVKIIIAIALMFLLYALFLLITSIINRIFGRPRYGPTDAPPIRYRKNKRY